jgi:hypothetical protein
MRDSVHIYAGVPSCGWARVDGPCNMWKITQGASIVTYIHPNKWITWNNCHPDLNTRVEHLKSDIWDSIFLSPGYRVPKPGTRHLMFETGRCING